jgi:hypothetical protein
MVTKWYKIKKGKSTKIDTPKNIGSYLDKRYTLTKVTEKGNKTKIQSYSPLTREQAWKKMSWKTLWNNGSSISEHIDKYDEHYYKQLSDGQKRGKVKDLKKW